MTSSVSNSFSSSSIAIAKYKLAYLGSINHQRALSGPPVDQFERIAFHNVAHAAPPLQDDGRNFLENLLLVAVGKGCEELLQPDFALPIEEEAVVNHRVYLEYSSVVGPFWEESEICRRILRCVRLRYTGGL
jgi:hypothetical protein